MSRSSSSAKISVVNVGIGPDHPAIPDELRDRLRNAIQESIVKMDEAGYDFDSLAINPDEQEKAMKSIVDSLKERHRNAVIIGGGIRKMPPMIPILEDIINTTKILFAEWPTGVLDSVKRLKQARD